jgi:AbrB family looped-hinge helix DNA binding protein
MTLVKLKEKGQVTIPAAVRAQISAHKGDMFEVDVANGNIVLKPRDIVSRKRPTATKVKQGVDISSWIGSGKGLFQSPEEAAEFIRSERTSWD